MTGSGATMVWRQAFTIAVAPPVPDSVNSTVLMPANRSDALHASVCAIEPPFEKPVANTWFASIRPLRDTAATIARKNAISLAVLTWVLQQEPMAFQEFPRPWAAT